MQRVRFPTSRPVLAGKEEQYVLEALHSGWISGHGPFTRRFEKAVGDFLDLPDGIAVNSGTAALQLALRCLEVGPESEVIVPALTFVACPNAVHYCGGTPVFADCHPLTRNLTPETIEAALTPKTRGVLFVHLFGLSDPIDEVARFCREKGLWLLEDCAHSLGARQEGKLAGTFGDAAIFSFYGNKILSTGEGGMVFLRDPEKRALALCLREQGMDPARRHWHTQQGYNFRMPNLSAAIGCGQMEMIDYHIGERRRIGRRYEGNLQSLQEKKILRLPAEPEGSFSVYWLFSIVLLRGGATLREKIQQRLLQEFGVQTRPFYVPMHQLPIYRKEICLPHAEYLSRHGIVLPTYSGLQDEEVDEICDALKTCLSELNE